MVFDVHDGPGELAAHLDDVFVVFGRVPGREDCEVGVDALGVGELVPGLHRIHGKKAEAAVDVLRIWSEGTGAGKSRLL